MSVQVRRGEDERERVGAEREYAEQVGESVGFDHGAIDAGESAEAVLADELVEKYAAMGMGPALALVMARELLKERGASEAVDLEVWAWTVFCLLRKIVEAPKPLLTARCTQMAFGFREANDDSMRAVAAKSEVTVARVSDLTKEIRETHELAINSFNKSEAAARIYRLTNKKSREKL